MKRNFLITMMVTLLVTLFSTRVDAFATNNQLSMESHWINLQVRYDDPTLGEHNPHRSSVSTPDVYIDGYTLTFDESCDECTLRIVNDEDEVEFTTVIMSNTVVLPSTLQGEYEIQIIRGNYCFYGDVEL